MTLGEFREATKNLDPNLHLVTDPDQSQAEVSCVQQMTICGLDDRYSFQHTNCCVLSNKFQENLEWGLAEYPEYWSDVVFIQPKIRPPQPTYEERLAAGLSTDGE